MPCGSLLGACPQEDIFRPTYVAQLNLWRDDPASSPFWFLRSRKKSNVRLSHPFDVRGPTGNITFWSEEEAGAIAARVMALQHTHWTLMGSSQGVPNFLLGKKYGGSLFNGTLVYRNMSRAIVRHVWKEFDDVFEVVLKVVVVVVLLVSWLMAMSRCGVWQWQ